MTRKCRTSRVWTLPDDEFIRLVAVSKTHKDVASYFGFVRSTGRYHTTIKARIAELGISTDHFMKRRDWAIASLAANVDEVFCENSKHLRCVAKRHYEKLEVKVCRECGQEPEWNGKPLVMVLDHINGVSNDHRLENLRWLCPNCNSQMPTFAGRNVKRRKSFGG